MTIRQEQPQDVSAIQNVHKKTFNKEDELTVVDLLRTNKELVLSLVFEQEDNLIGNIEYSPMTDDNREVAGAALGYEEAYR